MSVLRRTVLLVLALLLATAAAPLARHQPSPQDAKQEYVPVDPSAQQEQLPAAPLVIGAYSVVWVALIGYLWSIWRRLARVEREIAQVTQRVQAGDR
jgi:CcmD family protein